MILDGLVIDHTKYNAIHGVATVRLTQGLRLVADIQVKEDPDEPLDFGTRLVVMIQENA